MRLPDLTDRQQSVLDFIVHYQQTHRIAPSVREIAAHLGLRSPAGIHRVLGILKDRGYIKADPGKKRAWRISRKVPVRGIALLGDIAAGAPLEALPMSDETLNVDPAVFGSGRCFGLRVKGDSMTGAQIAHGDIAIIRPQPWVENSEIAAVTVEGILTEATLKIVHRTKSTLILKPANPKHRQMRFRQDDRERVTIIGKCVGIIRRI